MTSEVVYIGDLRTTAKHLRSGSSIETDAPTDNHGKGDRFSPTDLVATALASCILTTLAIAESTHDINIMGATAEVEKIMTAAPRTIGEIIVTISFPKSGPYTDKEKAKIEHIAVTCPVHKSLAAECKRTIKFNWPE